RGPQQGRAGARRVRLAGVARASSRPRAASPRGWMRLPRRRRLGAFLTAQACSLTGTWAAPVALARPLWRTTGSPAALGVVALAGQLPALLLAPLSGALVDRWELRRLLVVTQLLSALQSLALAALACSGTAPLGALAALASFQGIVNALDMP